MKWLFSILVLAALMTILSGCTTDSQTVADVTPSPAETYATPVPTEESYVVTSPVLVKDEDISSTKISVTATEGGSSLLVTVKFDSTNTFGTTGSGYKIMSTIFAYNYDDVSPSFNPKTKDDIIAAGIPFKRVMTTLYPNNVKNAIADLPGESTQGKLATDREYNYGAIVDLEDTTN